MNKEHIKIQEEYCKGCKYCIEACPKNVLAESKELNKKGYHPPIVVDEGNCNACKLCEFSCPDFAIYLEETKQNRKEKDL